MAIARHFRFGDWLADESTTMKNETKRVNELLGKLLAERGEVCERNAPEAWVKLARALERELNSTNKALDELHIVCETSKPEIFNWYLTDQFAAEARKNAIERLLANRDAESANAKPTNRASET